MRRAVASFALVAWALCIPSGGAATGGPLSDKVVIVGFVDHSPAVVALSVGGGTTVLTPRYLPPELLDPSQVASGTTRQQFPSPTSLAVSPDGRTVAFATDGPDSACCGYGYEGELFAIQADGSGLRRLTTTPGRNESRPVFSSDGKRIAVLQDANLDGTASKVSLAVLNLDGTGLRVVATAKAGELASNVQVAWHPDGKRLLFYPGLAYSGGLPEHSLLIDLASGVRRTVYGGPAEFSPDGTRLATMWGGEIYAGPLTAFAKRDFARRLRPVVAQTFTTRGERLSSPDDFAWLRDGRLAYAVTVPTAERGCLNLRSTFGILDRRGARKVIGRNVCGVGALTAPASSSLLLWHSTRLMVSPTSSWRPRALVPPGGFNLSAGYAFGYQPSTCVSGGSGC